MFNDEIVKNNNNPSVNATMETNKLTWNSSAMSNVASLGESTNGLFAFNDTVKNSIKYMYLNNNKFSNINALQDFSNIIELQCQCNPNLSNVDGLGDHKSLSILTLQGCKLTSLGRNKTESKEYTGGLTGCSSLSKLSIQSNSSLNSLVGIESCSNSLVCLVANNCNLIEFML